MDTKLFLLIFQWGQTNKTLVNLSIQITKASSKFFFIVYVTGVLYLAAFHQQRLIPFLSIPFSLLVMNLFLRGLIKRPRPYTALCFKPLTEEKAAFSCPSNHGSSSCIIALACFAVHPVLGAILLVLAFVTGLSRVATGMHYPGDIILGWSLAFILHFSALYLLFPLIT